MYQASHAADAIVTSNLAIDFTPPSYTLGASISEHNLETTLTVTDESPISGIAVDVLDKGSTWTRGHITISGFTDVFRLLEITRFNETHYRVLAYRWGGERLVNECVKNRDDKDA